MSQEEVLAAARRYLENVHRAGPDNIAATCPFHIIGERVTTTLSMSLSRGVWFCFSCHEKGNLQSFLRKIGVPRQEVELRYRYLIEELEEYRPEPLDPLRVPVVSDNPLPEGLLGLFDMCPLDLLREGFTEETLQAFEIGFDEKHYRITFPLRDLQGKLVGISGRTIFQAVEPRYKLYDHEYEAFGLPKRTTPRSTLLWNIHNVYPEVFFTNRPDVILVEGFKTCMWLVQAGVKNTVALLGSFLTDEQRWILERMGARVFVMLDNDPAGQEGRHYIGKVLSHALPVYMVEFDETIHQPSDLDQEQVLKALEGAQEYHCWSMQRNEGTRWHSEKTPM